MLHILLTRVNIVVCKDTDEHFNLQNHTAINSSGKSSKIFAAASRCFSQQRVKRNLLNAWLKKKLWIADDLHSDIEQCRTRTTYE